MPHVDLQTAMAAGLMNVAASSGSVVTHRLTVARDAIHLMAFARAMVLLHAQALDAGLLALLQLATPQSVPEHVGK